MSSKKIPVSIQCLQQLKDIFALDPLIRDIDFSHWYKYISMIIACEEYLGNDYPLSSVFQIKFKNINKFSLNLAPGFTETLEYCSRKGDTGFPLRSGDIQLTKENDCDNKTYYKLILGSLSSISQTSIKICFTDVEIAFLGEWDKIQKIEQGNCFLTPMAKNQILYHLL